MNRTIVAAILSAMLLIVPNNNIDAQDLPARISTAALSAFPDFIQVRAKYLSTVITAHPSRALLFKTVYADSPAGKIKVAIENGGDSFYVLFLRERAGEYPYGSQGNVIIERDTKTGFVTGVVWYLSDDGKSWLSLTPKNERTLIDYVIAGTLVRGGYSVSRLIYNFFTNPFSYTYEATKSGLDWSHILGQPDPGVNGFIANLSSGVPSGPAAQLLRAANDFSAVGNYLESAGRSGFEPEEITSLPFDKIAISAGVRSPVLATVKPYLASRGLSIDAVPGLLVRGIGGKSAFIALFESIDGGIPLQLAIIPYNLPSGGYGVAAVNAANGRPVDIMEIAGSMPGVYVRLFRLPLPVTP